MQFGFDLDRWEALARALKQHALENEVAREEKTIFGTRYIIDGLFWRDFLKRRKGAMDMKGIFGITLVLAVLTTFSSPAEAVIKIDIAEVQKGVAFIKGNGAQLGAQITWEGGLVTTANNKNGGFSFFGVLPGDCVGELSDGNETGNVQVLNCTPVASVLLPRTGQITSYAAGDDGALQKGVAWPNPRFTVNINAVDDNGAGGGTAGNGMCDGTETCNGTVTDNLTGRAWLLDLRCSADQPRNWQDALNFVTGINDGTNNCGDTSNGGAHQTDWRLPNVRELLSLVDYGPHTIPNDSSLPADHPFRNFDHSLYRSSTTGYPSSGAPSTDRAWVVNFNPSCPCSLAITFGKTGTNWVVAVRGGL
jgi:hypothetical protein